MLDFIALNAYQGVFKWSVFIVAAFFAMKSLLMKAEIPHPRYRNNKYPGIIVLVLFLFLFMLVSLRPISYAFGDMGNYYKAFIEYQSGLPLREGDIIFEYLMKFFSATFSAELFFFFCSCVYFFPILWACIRIFGRLWPYAFIFIASQFDFYSYSVNGIRNGMAASVFILALSYQGIRSWALVVVAVGLHKSLMLPAMAYGLVYFYANSRFYLALWVSCLLMSIFYSGFGDWISSSGLVDDRFKSYLEFGNEFDSRFAAVGFRLDFVLYSLLPILVGYYFLILKRMPSVFYRHIFCIYLVSNAFWLLVIRMPFSNRFAYLSWFMAGLVIAYPFLKMASHKGHNVAYVALLMSFSLFSLMTS